MPRNRMLITFDLDTNALKEYYPNKSWTNSYRDIRQHMKRNGFAWQEGSVYISSKPMAEDTAISILEELIEKCKWMNVCARDCVVSRIGKGHSQNHLFDKEADIAKRKRRDA